MRQAVVDEYPLLGKILAQHLLARIGHAHQLSLMVEVIQAVGIVGIVADRYFVPSLRCHVGR